MGVVPGRSAPSNGGDRVFAAVKEGMQLDKEIHYRRLERKDSEDSLASLAAEDRILLATNSRATELGTIAGRALVGGSSPIIKEPPMVEDSPSSNAKARVDDTPFVFDDRETRDRRVRRKQL